MIRASDASFRQMIDCECQAPVAPHAAQPQRPLCTRAAPAELTIRSANSRVSHASWPCASPLAPPWPTLPGRSRTPLPNPLNTASPLHITRAARATPQAPNKLSRPRIFFLPYFLAPLSPPTRRRCPGSGVTLPSPARQQWFQTCGNNAHLSFSCHSMLPETRSKRYPGT